MHLQIRLVKQLILKISTKYDVLTIFLASFSKSMLFSAVITHSAAFYRCCTGRFAAMSGKMHVSPLPPYLEIKGVGECEARYKYVIYRWHLNYPFKLQCTTNAKFNFFISQRCFFCLLDCGHRSAEIDSGTMSCKCPSQDANRKNRIVRYRSIIVLVSLK